MIGTELRTTKEAEEAQLCLFCSRKKHKNAPFIVSLPAEEFFHHLVKRERRPDLQPQHLWRRAEK